MVTIFETAKIPDGYSWTIVSKLGHILCEAETKYGERDKQYTILGIEIKNETQPGHWFPGNCKNIAIQLNQHCMEDMNRAVYQVAHEIIHCLSPTGGANANVLEEGLATHFSAEYAENYGHGIWAPKADKYKIALSLFETLLTIDSDIIKKVRKIQPKISLITSDNLIEANEKIPRDLADRLTAKF